MTSQDLLEAEMALALLRHGRSAVLRALGARLNLPTEELELEIEQIRTAPLKRKKRSAPGFSIDTLLIDNEDKASVLKTLEARFENRTFLSELKDVHRFLDRNSYRTPRLKSRAVAKKNVFSVLAKLDNEQLERLLAEPSSRADSSLGLISDQILGKHKPDK
jgi:hypothetical protein